MSKILFTFDKLCYVWQGVKLFLLLEWNSVMVHHRSLLSSTYYNKTDFGYAMLCSEM